MKLVIKISLVLSCAFLCSCMNFEKQTLILRYDKANDKLCIFQNYEGIYGDKGEDELDGNEQNQLDSVVNSGRTFFFGNWIFEISLDGIEKSIKEDEENLNNLQRMTTAEESQGAINVLKERVSLKRSMLTNVKIKNGKFYLNKDGKLCGYQYVTLNNASEMVEDCNRLISAYAMNANLDDMDKSFYRKLKDAALAKHTWIKLDGSSIRADVPMPYDYFQKMKSDKAESITQIINDPDKDKKALAEQIQGLISVLNSDAWGSYVDDKAIIAIGHPSKPYAKLTGNVSSKYTDNAVKYVKDKYGIEENVDAEKLIKDFLEAKEELPNKAR